MKRPTWYHYACEIRVKIDSLPQNSQLRRFQLILDSHQDAVTEHDYLGALSDWEYLIETHGDVSKAA